MATWFLSDNKSLERFSSYLYIQRNIILDYISEYFIHWSIKLIAKAIYHILHIKFITIYYHLRLLLTITIIGLVFIWYFELLCLIYSSDLGLENVDKPPVIYQLIFMTVEVSVSTILFTRSIQWCMIQYYDAQWSVWIKNFHFWTDLDLLKSKLLYLENIVLNLQNFWIQPNPQSIAGSNHKRPNSSDLATRCCHVAMVSFKIKNVF